MSDLPNKINATFVVTYDVNDLRNNLAELNGVEEAEIKDHEIATAIYGLLGDDFGALAPQVILQDENGEEVTL